MHGELMLMMALKAFQIKYLDHKMLKTNTIVILFNRFYF